MIEAGELDRRVTVQEPVITYNELNEPVLHEYRDLAIKWAKIHTLTSIESFCAKQAQKDTTHKIKLRWFAGLTSAHRLVYQKDDVQHVLNITGLVDTDFDHVEWIIEATETTNV